MFLFLLGFLGSSPSRVTGDWCLWNAKGKLKAEVWRGKKESVGSSNQSPTHLVTWPAFACLYLRLIWKVESTCGGSWGMGGRVDSNSNWFAADDQGGCRPGDKSLLCRPCKIEFLLHIDACFSIMWGKSKGFTGWISRSVLVYHHHVSLMFGAIITCWYKYRTQTGLQVLGAAMFYVKAGDDTVVYTGDYNMTPDRHLGAAQIDRLEPDLLITE